MRNKEIKILFYDDNPVLIAENENDLQKLLFLFDEFAKTLGKTISAVETKFLTTSKTLQR